MAETALPFRTAESGLAAEPWHYISHSGIPVHLESFVPGWDYQFDLQLIRVVVPDAPAICAQCGLGKESRLRLSVVAASSASRYRRCVWHSEIRENRPITISATIPGSELAESLSLETLITLVKEPERIDRFAPSLPGSRLIAEIHHVRLEGHGGRFPMEVVNFESQLSHLRAPHAYWHLARWEHASLESPVLREIQLLLNSGQEDFLKAATEGDPCVQSLVSCDVARQLIRGFLEDPEATLDEPYPPGSLGEAISNLVRLYFPRSTLEAVRRIRDNSISQFEAMIQSGAGGV